MPATNWTPQSTNPTNYTPQSINPTAWNPGTPEPPTAFLLLQTGAYLLQQDEGLIGLQ